MVRILSASLSSCACDHSRDQRGSDETLENSFIDSTGHCSHRGRTISTSLLILSEFLFNSSDHLFDLDGFNEVVGNAMLVSSLEAFIGGVTSQDGNDAAGLRFFHRLHEQQTSR